MIEAHTMETKDTAGIIERLEAVAQHDWRISFLAHTSDTAKEAITRIKELENALRPFCASGNPTMDELLWGKMDDDALGTISVRLKHFRAARAALNVTPSRNVKSVCTTYHSRAIGLACSNCGHPKDEHIRALRARAQGE